MAGIKLNGLLFLLPFILVASVGIYQNSFADTTTVGETFFDTTNPDGTHTWSSHEPYIFDGTNWVPSIVTGTTVQTGHGSVTLNADGSFSFYPKGIINDSPLFTDKIIAKYADVTNLNSWTYPNTLNNDVPDVSWDGTSLTSSKVKSGVGQLDYKFILSDGKWKTQLEATNLSALTTKAFGFDQIIDLNRDTISFGENQINLDNFNGTTYDHTWLVNHKSKVLNFMNNVFFDFDIAFDDLYSVTVYDTGVGKSRLVFDYRTSTSLLPSQKLVLDPTYSYTGGTQLRYKTTDAVSGSCPTTYSSSSSTATNNPDYQRSDLNNGCYFANWEWNLSAIPNGATSVSNSKIKFSVSGHTGTNPAAASCDFVPTRPQSDTGQHVLDDILGNTPYLNDNTDCASVQTLKEETLGSTANTDILTAITGDDKFNIALKFSTASRTTSDTWLDNTAMQLTFDYSAGSPPNPVTSMTYANLGPNSVDVIWSAPTSFGSGTFQTYVLNSTHPWNAPLTFRSNQTSLYANVTGLIFGTQYSFRVAAATEIAYNTTGSYILNVTTTSTSYNTPPTLVRVIPNGYTSTSQLNEVWTAGTMTNVLGYRIERQDNGGSWSCAVASCNTTNTNLYYNDTGLSTGTIYNYRIYSLNASGISTASNEKSMTTYHKPNAITDLTATASDFTTVALSWSAPTSYAPSITGYQVNVTSPTGEPLTIWTPDPYTTTTNAIIYGLTVGDDYSFRVSAITFHGKNDTGNIVNVTTSNLFTPGEINPLVSQNTADFKIFYTRTDTNSTYTTLDVTYPDTYDLNCNFQYQFGGQNDTYTGLTQTVVDADNVMSTFAFVDPANDIINVRCYDTITDDEAKYVLVINQFPFLDQINNMRNGAYGTYFQFGAIDGVTLMICILAMIGFNRTNPVAGIMFLVITVGVLSWFNIITYPIVMYPALALLATWAFISTRKDD